MVDPQSELLKMNVFYDQTVFPAVITDHVLLQNIYLLYFTIFRYVLNNAFIVTYFITYKNVSMTRKIKFCEKNDKFTKMPKKYTSQE